MRHVIIWFFATLTTFSAPIQPSQSAPPKMRQLTHHLMRAPAAEPRPTFSVLATSYCDKGRTADGTRVSIRSIAVDRHVIPLGTRLRIIFSARHIPPGAKRVAAQFAGTVVAHDTGGAIRGKRIDIWTPNCPDALEWGARTVSLRLVADR